MMQLKKGNDMWKFKLASSFYAMIYTFEGQLYSLPSPCLVFLGRGGSEGCEAPKYGVIVNQVWSDCKPDTA